MLTPLAILGFLPLVVMALLTLVPVTLLRICVERAKRYEPGKMLRVPKSLADCDRTRRAA